MNRTIKAILFGTLLAAPILYSFQAVRAQSPAPPVASEVPAGTDAKSGKSDGTQNTNDQDGEIIVNYKDWVEKYQEVADAVKKFEANDIAGTLSELEAARRKYPELPPGELMVAAFYAGNRDMVIVALDTAARQHPD
ncbi:MAG: hypothetical protein N2C12_11835, partial [Planctomycetales bacterium]